ncbi:MAG: hypothetical protein JWO80_1498, partial [Bryobacterales bacterium]|nr:hypothetical protein [Bryobacterales bacterium]
MSNSGLVRFECRWLPRSYSFRRALRS